MLMIVFFIFICFNYDLFEIPVLNCQSSYEAMGVGPAGWIYRQLYILFATCLVVMRLALSCRKKICHLPFWENTQCVYIYVTASYTNTCPAEQMHSILSMVQRLLPLSDSSHPSGVCAESGSR